MDDGGIAPVWSGSSTALVLYSLVSVEDGGSSIDQVVSACGHFH